MAVEFKLPELGENIESADVATIHVSEGDTIEADQPVMELETEKAALDVPCPHAGTVSKIHVSEGDTVQIGQTLLTIEEAEGAAAAEAPAEKPAEEKPAEEKPAAPEEPPRRKTAAEARAEAPPPPTPERPPERPAPAARADGKRVPVPAGPATRRLARKLQVDLGRLSGSGPGGRITQEDVVEAYSGRGAPAAAGPAAEFRAPPLPDFSRFGPVERQRLNKIGRTSVQNLSLSWRVVPHVTQHNLADVTELESARKRFIEMAGEDLPKITMTAIVTKAVVAVLREHPKFNASFDAETNEIVLKQYYHIGVAVDTEAGLLVPVIRDADRKNVLQIAGELNDLAKRARNRKLDLSAMEGGTFTISNQGGIGGTSFTPIVNYPEVAILGMSRTQKQLQLVDGQPENRLMLPLSLSYDHRVINGADAARFIVQLSEMLSDPFELLIGF